MLCQVIRNYHGHLSGAAALLFDMNVCFQKFDKYTLIIPWSINATQPSVESTEVYCLVLHPTLNILATGWSLLCAVLHQWDPFKGLLHILGVENSNMKADIR